MGENKGFPFIDVDLSKIDEETLQPSNQLVPIEKEVEEVPKMQAPSFPPREPPRAAIPQGGPLFTPDNDPLLVHMEHQIPVHPSLRGQGVPNRLRHLVSEPVQRSYRDPSGRNRIRDRF